MTETSNAKFLDLPTIVIGIVFIIAAVLELLGFSGVLPNIFVLGWIIFIVLLWSVCYLIVSIIAYLFKKEIKTRLIWGLVIATVILILFIIYEFAAGILPF
ncbi:MAG: hypothetical protein ALMCE001_02750 [Methanocorpusculum sp. MCE]|nr:MAG: hypothetical protein ALMCE001_02750 [Methanocorpusculum sp. MCE]